MPTNTPSISQVYAAFDEQCHCIFRRAMGNSRGGVVRVQNLILAIVESNLPPRHPELTAPADALRGLAAQRSTSAADEHIVPMSNEPALRELLGRAWQIAAAQSETTAPRITSACLAASVLADRTARRSRSLPDVFDGLGLTLPPDLAAVSTPQAVARPVREAEPARQNDRPLSEQEAGQMIDAALMLWLEIQNQTDPATQSEKISRLKQMVHQIEGARQSI